MRTEKDVIDRKRTQRKKVIPNVDQAIDVIKANRNFFLTPLLDQAAFRIWAMSDRARLPVIDDFTQQLERHLTKVGLNIADYENALVGENSVLHNQYDRMKDILEICSELSLLIQRCGKNPILEDAPTVMREKIPQPSKQPSDVSQNSALFIKDLKKFEKLEETNPKKLKEMKEKYKKAKSDYLTNPVIAQYRNTSAYYPAGWEMRKKTLAETPQGKQRLEKEETERTLKAAGKLRTILKLAIQDYKLIHEKNQHPIPDGIFKIEGLIKQLYVSQNRTHGKLFSEILKIVEHHSLDGHRKMNTYYQPFEFLIEKHMPMFFPISFLHTIKKQKIFNDLLNYYKDSFEKYTPYTLNNIEAQTQENEIRKSKVEKLAATTEIELQKLTENLLRFNNGENNDAENPNDSAKDHKTTLSK